MSPGSVYHPTNNSTSFFKSRSVPSIRIAVSESDGNLIWFIKWLNNTKIIIQQYSGSYHCVMPEYWKGKLLNIFSEDCTEHQTLTVTIIVVISCFILVVMYYLQLISQLENLYNVCTTYAHILPLEQELVFRVPAACTAPYQ
jgi:hypothetical protein